MDIARTTGFMEGVVAADSALYQHAVVKVEFAIVLREVSQGDHFGRWCQRGCDSFAAHRVDREVVL
ncbi:MAG TPA: hypothetical protein VN714_25820 [Trebonia sp.]|jgi:hypothetical protein|nr:hypothetical protein [Trebonia sp.]